MSYVDPFKDLNDTKRKEREALLNHPEFNQASPSRHFAPPIVIPPAISRRDYFVAAAFQALVSSRREWKASDLVDSSIELADELIEKLDGEAKP